MKTKRAFTLIELLVVISIISMLLAILLPALNRARELGRRAVCMANVRRLAIAGIMYVEDHGAFPPFRVGNPEYVNRYGRQRPRWQWYFDHGVGPVIDPQPYAGDTFADRDTLLMTNDYFICPTFNYPDFDPYDIRNGSYGYNWQYLGNSRVTGDRYQNFPVSAAKVRTPSRTIIIGDSRGGDIPHGGHSYTLDPPKLATEVGARRFGPGSTPIQHSPASDRHNKSANIAFVDGHAKAMSLEELGYILDENENVIPNHAQGSNVLWKASR